MDNEGILGVDIECTECGKLMALSNAFKYDHKYLCPKCAPDLDEITSSHQIPRGATVRSKTMYEQKLERELTDLKHKIWGLQQMVEFQTADEGLWHIDATAPEAYLQDALRKLHHCIEQAVTLANDSKEVE